MILYISNLRNGDLTNIKSYQTGSEINQEKNKEMALNLSRSQPADNFVRTDRPKPSVSLLQVTVISRLKLSSSECSDITCSIFFIRFVKRKNLNDFISSGNGHIIF